MQRRKEDGTWGRALDLWRAPDGAGDPLVCVATSYTFDATFFETECIGRFLQMDRHPAESESVAYLIEREDKLAGARVCAIVDRRHARDKENWRWDVLGALAPNGIQHSKAALLAWSHHVRVIIGSGNLTEPGYRKNVEVFGTIELSETDGGPAESIEEAIDFLDFVVEWAVGEEGPATPKGRAHEALAMVRRRISNWPRFGARIRDAVPVFGRPGAGVLGQLSGHWPGGGPPRTACIVSPFFDRSDHDRQVVEGLISLMARKRPRELCFDVRTESLPDGRKRVYAPLGMLKAARETCDIHVRSVLPEQQDEVRDLHAKMLRLESDQWQMLLAGSSNFTAAGLLGGNLEANLVYRVKNSDQQWRRIGAIWPDTSADELDLDSPDLIWDPESEELEGGGNELPLPAAFRDAIFVPGQDPQLRITLTADLPVTWSIRTVDGVELLSSSLGSGAGDHVLSWASHPPPLVLEVTWTRLDAVAVATWPVNVSDPGALPPIAELKALTLEQLLEILSSSLPLPESVSRALQKRSGTARGISDVELDPLRRHDSPTFLLRRTKRVGVALRRLQERLERPAATEDAIRWRLHGPIGPMSLAEAFVREANLPGEARFYLAELALTLARVNAEKVAAGGLSARTVSVLLASVVRDLEEKARSFSSSSETATLEEYAEAAFAKARGI